MGHRSLRVLCESRRACRSCRRPGPEGDAFRASVASVYAWPDAPACPYGVPIGATLPPKVWRLWRGGGDALEWLLRVTRVGPLYKRVRSKLTGRPCGCAGRRAWFNRLLPFGRRSAGDE